jgi:prepilin-type N-terminal cleavage/methylation domain-containing protein
MRDRKAFSLVEMLVVVLIIGAIAVIAIPRITNTSKSAKDRICKTNVDLMNRQIELYHLASDSWPQKLKDVTENLTYFPDGPPECPLGWDYKINSENYRVIDHGDHTQEAQGGDGGDSHHDSHDGGRRGWRSWWRWW